MQLLIITFYFISFVFIYFIYLYANCIYRFIAYKNERTRFNPLERYSFDKITAAIVIDTRKAKKSTTKDVKIIEPVSIPFDKKIEKDKEYYPVKHRVTYLRKQVYFPCMDLTLDEYDKLHKLVRSEYLTKTKKLIHDNFKKITDTIEDLVIHEGFYD